MSRFVQSLAFVLLVALLLVPRAAHASGAEGPQQRVTVGVYVNQILSIDLKGSAFTADFWVWFRTAPKTPSDPPDRGIGAKPPSDRVTAGAAIDTFEVISGRINSKSAAIKKTLPNGEDYAAVRVNATINRPFDLRKYPFDDHNLDIEIEDIDRDITRSVFVADTAAQGMDPEAAVTGFDLRGFEGVISDHTYPSNYGDLSITTAEARYSRYVMRVYAKRNGGARFIKVAFALFVAVLGAWCAFFIRPKDAGPRMAVPIGALFAAAAATIAINSQLPEINYATISDKTVFLSLGMIAVSLLASVYSLSLHYKGREAAYLRADRIGAVAFPAVFVILLFVLVR